MAMRASAAALAATLLAALTVGQLRAAPEQPKSPGGEPGRVHALVGATVVPRPGERIVGGTIVIRDGLIAAVGSGVPVPAEAQVWDLSGCTVYPGLIEPYLRLAPRKAGEREEGSGPQPPPKPATGARHANPSVRAERAVARELALSEDSLRGLRQAGFTAAVVVPEEGVFRGKSALVNLRDGSAREQIVRAEVAQHVAFERGGWTSQHYPSSLMGAMALVRQGLMDAEHYAAAWDHYQASPLGRERPETNLSLGALASALSKELPFCLEAEDVNMLLRGASLFREFELVPWVVLGDADAYRWLGEVQDAGVPLVLSLNFPTLPEWEDDTHEPDVSHAALRHAMLAPACPATLERARVRFAFTTQGLRSRADLHARVREAIARGLSPEAALAAFTTAPAALLGAPQLGVIAPGAIANLSVSAGELFAEGSQIQEVWVDGQRYPGSLEPPSDAELTGRWQLELPQLSGPLTLEIAAERGDLVARLSSKPGAEGLPIPFQRWRDRLRLVAPRLVTGLDFDAPLELVVAGPLARGSLRRGGEEGGRVLARKLHEEQEPAAGAPRPLEPLALTPRAPWPPLPEPAPRSVLIKDATIWTQGPQGVLEGASLLIEDGVVKDVGFRVKAPAGSLVIAAGGRHVTPGLIDCHSHSFGAGGVNEATNNCTAEVRMADVLDPDSVELYRQLGGGLTAAQQLHGSANAIGGQSAILRLRWGSPAPRLLFQGAAPAIKFALGENPKRSNWGEGRKPRYPTTRMGVIESIRERLVAARSYRRELEEWRRRARQGQPSAPPRIDLQLEALAEVLEGKRRVHCHSYRQDEILALIRLAEELGFTIGTFQHVLEGYKVADEIAAHGAGAATFSDWWAYKFEVYQATAYNAALMHRRGVLVSIKSDSSELARRLNMEAAKTLRYGELKPSEALATVTLNPARQLGVDASVGSLEVGKQADFVIWSAPPLSSTARCDETWIQGRRYFQRERDRDAYLRLQAERTALLLWGRQRKGTTLGERSEGAWQATFPEGGRAAAEHGHDEDHHCGSPR